MSNELSIYQKSLFKQNQAHNKILQRAIQRFDNASEYLDLPEDRRNQNIQNDKMKIVQRATSETQSLKELFESKLIDLGSKRNLREYPNITEDSKLYGGKGYGAAEFDNAERFSGDTNITLDTKLDMLNDAYSHGRTEFLSYSLKFMLGNPNYIYSDRTKIEKFKIKLHEKNGIGEIQNEYDSIKLQLDETDEALDILLSSPETYEKRVRRQIKTGEQMNNETDEE